MTKYRIHTKDGIKELDGLMMSGVLDINGKEIKEGDVLLIRRYENEGRDMTCKDREILGPEYIKGNYKGEYTADVIFEDGSLTALERGDIKKLHGLYNDPITFLGNVNCFDYEEAEIIG